MLRILFLIFAFLLPLSAQAQSRCMPWEINGDWTFSEIVRIDTMNTTGPLIVYDCIWTDNGAVTWMWQRHCLEHAWPELGVGGISNLGARIETIRKATDQRAAFNAAWKRYVTRPSPRCRAVLDELK